MNVAIGEIIVWIIVGALSGSLAGWLVSGSRRGFGIIRNIIIGMVGAVIGAFMFRVFNIRFGLGQISISLEDLVAAFVGSLILLGLITLLSRRRR